MSAATLMSVPATVIAVVVSTKIVSVGMRLNMTRYIGKCKIPIAAKVNIPDLIPRVSDVVGGARFLLALGVSLAQTDQ